MFIIFKKLHEKDLFELKIFKQYEIIFDMAILIKLMPHIKGFFCHIRIVKMEMIVFECFQCKVLFFFCMILKLYRICNNPLLF